ncbi:MAG: carboxylating nicotinate-nucleotide diphosphorylase [Saprospiraceae bacterium]|nr:carboxylating nicotinate-nucleotide diphosphorylase [Saprospiraceae bacterium]
MIEAIKPLIDQAFAEDLGTSGDHSAKASIPADAEKRARLLVKDTGIIAGVELAEMIFNYYDSSIHFERLIPDGSPVKYGDEVFHVSGKVHTLLSVERIVLNFMQRMSGIATLSNTYAKAVEGTNTKVLDTRKTTPGLRYIEKWAVRIGGGHNHRMGLYDMIMLKDNHNDYAGGIPEAINSTRKYIQDHDLTIQVEMETRNLDEVREVLATGGVDRIMLDNFTPVLVKEAVAIIGDQAETEASGGITLETIRAYAEAGVDYISVGALTHSFKSLDMSLKAF